MFKLICCLLCCLPWLSMAGGVVVAAPDVMPKYVCFDGRRLICTTTGFIWEANRGCFISKLPCETHNARPYGRYVNGRQLILSYNRCRRNYPFRLGEMQTH